MEVRGERCDLYLPQAPAAVSTVPAPHVQVEFVQSIVSPQSLEVLQEMPTLRPVHTVHLIVPLICR